MIDIAQRHSIRRPPSEPMPAIEGYTLLHEIHRGAQGVVYKAVQNSTARAVALKVLTADPDASPRARRRFEREVELVAALQHPNIVTLFDSGLTSGRYFFAMEYVPGRPLDVYVAGEAPSVEDILRLFVKICDAVHYAHQRGIIHRDLKPSNIRVDDRGEPHVLDFGLAKGVEAEYAESGGALTRTSEFLGTLAYASPEQVKGDPTAVDTRSDVYALGVILYQLLTGQLPHRQGMNLADFIRQLSSVDPTPPSSIRSELRGDPETILLKALSRDRGRRYQTAGALADDLRRLLAGQAIQAKRDSAAYVLWMRSRSVLRRHAVASVALVLGTVLLTSMIVSPLLMQWTPAWRRFERAMVMLVGPRQTTGALPDVRLVGLMDDTDIDAIARREGLTDVSSRNLKSYRRLHGRLMERLASAGPRVVAWDIVFESTTDHDSAFVDGARALKEAGVDVIVAVWEWWGDGAPKLSRVIAPEVRCGGIVGGFNAKRPWRIQAVMQRALRDPLASLALTAVAAYRHPGTGASLVLDRDRRAVEILYHRASESMPQAKRWLDASDRIVLTEVVQMGAKQSASAASVGLEAEDWFGTFLLSMPPDAVLSESTIPYQRIFESPDAQLRDWFEGKVVVMGDMRKNKDPHPHPDGRTLPGCCAHAVAIQHMLTQLAQPRWWPRTSSRMFDDFIAAILGLGIAAAGRRRVGVRLLLLGAGAVMMCAVSGWLAWRLHMLWFPLAPAVAMVLSCELAAGVHRVRTARLVA